MTNFGVRSFMMVFLLVATGLGALVLGAMPADQGPPCEGSRHPLAPTASDGPLPSDVVEGTPSEHEHSVRNAGMLVTDHSPLWTEDFNDVWVRPGLYNHICATCRPHEPIEVTVTVENLGIYDEASVRVDLSATDASGRASASASRTLSVTAGDKVDVDLGLKLNRAGFYVLTTNVTAALDEVADDNLANSSVLVDKWIDDLEGDITGWDAGGAWAVGSKSGASHSPTHYWHFERSPGTTTGDELVSPVIDLRLYDRSAKLPPNLAQGGINYCIFFNMYFQGRLYGTGQDSIDLLMRASNTTTWTSLVKYDGNTQVGGGTPPGDFSSEWFRYNYGIYMGDYAGQTVQFKWRFVKGSQFSSSWWSVDDTIVFMHAEKNVPPWFIKRTPEVVDVELEVGKTMDFGVFAVDLNWDEPITYTWYEDGEPRTDWTGNWTTLDIPRTAALEKYSRGHTLHLMVSASDGETRNDTYWKVHLIDPRPGPTGECGGPIFVDEDEPTDVDFGTASDPTWFLDPEGQEFTVTCTGSRNIDVRERGDNVLAFVNKVPNWNGMDNITLTVTDSAGSCTNFTVMVRVLPVNDSPKWKPVMLPKGEQDKYYSFNLTATDVDDLVGDLSYSDDADLFDISASGEIAFVPRNAQVGFNFFNVTVRDPGGLTDVMELRLSVANVNDPPVLRYILPQFAIEDEVFTLDVSPYVEDPDLLLPPELRDRMTYRDDVYWLETNVETGVVTWDTPTRDDVGDHWFTITVQDSKGRYAQQEVRITVEEKDRPIRYGPIPPQLLHQGVTYSYEVPVENQEQWGEWVELLHSNDHQELFVIGQSTGLIHFTPGNEHVGEWRVTLTLRDLLGDVYDTRTVTFTVVNVNDPPDLEPPGPLQALEGVPFELQLMASDPDMTVRLVDGSPADPAERLSFGTTSEVARVDPDTGLLRMTPTREDARWGEVQVRVIVRDREGMEDTMVIVIPVGYVVPPPPPLPEVRWPKNGTTVDEGQEVAFRLVFPEGAIPEGTSLTVTVSSDQQGVLTTRATEGDLTFTLDGLSPGRHRITLMVSDVVGESSTWMELTVEGDLESQSGSLIVLGVTMMVMVGAVIAVVVLRRR